MENWVPANSASGTKVNTELLPSISRAEGRISEKLGNSERRLARERRRETGKARL